MRPFGNVELRPFLLGAFATLVAVGAALVLLYGARVLVGPRVLGHHAYAVAPDSSLVDLDAYGQVRMRKVAARAFHRMQEAAMRDDVLLVPVSGFRDLTKQRELFFNGAAQKGETLSERAKICAPPGFSEHHTGYSLDVGDGASHESDLVDGFRDTRAFRWLRANAAKYHFEMSFPPANKQGVAYEPWHWRFVGTPRAFRTFFPATLSRFPFP